MSEISKMVLRMLALDTDVCEYDVSGVGIFGGGEKGYLSIERCDIRGEQELGFGRTTRKAVYSGPPPSLLRWLSEVTPQQFDLVIIGNNLGSGLIKAYHLNPRMLNRSLVVWNTEPNDLNRRQYLRLGCCRHATRTDAVMTIKRMLGAVQLATL